MTISVKRRIKLRFNIYQIDMNLDKTNQKFKSYNDSEIKPETYEKYSVDV